jgi:hypothetical protein
MIIKLTAEADADLDRMDNSLYIQFRKHLDKIVTQPPRKHAKHGLPFFTENVGQGRIPVLIVKDTIIVMRCFEYHKEYDKWLSTFK